MKILVALAIATFTLHNAVAQVPQCPAEISGDLIRVQPVQTGWHGLASRRLLLDRAGIVIGPADIAARAELRGGERRIDTRRTQTRFSGLREQEQKWLVCSYGQGGDIEQVYRLPAAIDQCAITVTDNRSANRQEVRVVCE